MKKLPVDLPGLTEDMRAVIEERIREFEEKHEKDVFNRGSGWVPRIRRIDYLIALIVNLAFIIWMIIAFLT